MPLPAADILEIQAQGYSTAQVAAITTANAAQHIFQAVMRQFRQVIGRARCVGRKRKRGKNEI